MKAAVLHEYGPPSKLVYEDFPAPQPGPGQVLLAVLAASVNPVDWKMRSGAAKERFPVQFPGILGRDAAGVIRALGEGVKGFVVGDKVFTLTSGTYAELCRAPAEAVAKIPDGVDMTTAAAIPLVSVTGDQLIRQAAHVQPGQTVVLTGALGSVGRCALFAALEIGAKVIAGVRKSQRDEARALGATEVLDLGDEDAVAQFGLVDAVADTVGGEIASTLLGKVKQGGTFGSVLGPPANAALHPTVTVNAIMAHPDPAAFVRYAEAIRDGRLKLPIDRILPLEEAAEAHAAGEKGGTAKIILIPPASDLPAAS